MNRKKLAGLIIVASLLVVALVGSTLAWLLDSTNTITNTFTDSDINITLTETDTDLNSSGDQHEYKMIPGWTIDKDPKVTVEEGSEDCWLFVEITESTTPDLDAYITYCIIDGWDIVEKNNLDNDEDDDIIVIGRKVLKTDSKKNFSIIGYNDEKGIDDETDDVIVEDKVLVNSNVTKKMMDDIDKANDAKPTLSIKAYAVQLFKSNADSASESNEFTINEAWEHAKTLKN